MTDKEHAAEIRQAANALDAALNAAAKTGLIVDIETKAYGGVYHGQRLIKQCSWQTSIDAYRTTHFDQISEAAE